MRSYFKGWAESGKHSGVEGDGILSALRSANCPMVGSKLQIAPAPTSTKPCTVMSGGSGCPRSTEGGADAMAAPDQQGWSNAFQQSATSTISTMCMMARQNACSAKREPIANDQEIEAGAINQDIEAGVRTLKQRSRKHETGELVAALLSTRQMHMQLALAVNKANDMQLALERRATNSWHHCWLKPENQHPYIQNLPRVLNAELKDLLALPSLLDPHNSCSFCCLVNAQCTCCPQHLKIQEVIICC